RDGDAVRSYAEPRRGERAGAGRAGGALGCGPRLDRAPAAAVPRSQVLPSRARAGRRARRDPDRAADHTTVRVVEIGVLPAIGAALYDPRARPAPDQRTGPGAGGGGRLPAVGWRDSGSSGRGRAPTPTRRGGAFPNFADPDLIDPARWYHGANRTRLDRIKETYDPKNLFRRHPAAA